MEFFEVKQQQKEQMFSRTQKESDVIKYYQYLNCCTDEGSLGGRL